jgi:DNA-binding CsgD family transcriptional regulator
VYIFGVLNPLYINREYLELFILYFNDNAAHLINRTEHLKIPKEFIEDHSAPDLRAKNFVFEEMEQEFLDSINAKYYKIKKLQQQYSLSGRELQCLELILQNKITKQIANLLNLTTRTAETYIDNLKKKLDCHTKNEMVVKFFVR